MKLLILIHELKIVCINFKKRRQNNDKEKYYIFGIEKSGTVSLEKYLLGKGYDVVREESVYSRWYGVMKYFLQYPDYQTIMITRDPVERLWSHYNYKRFKQKGGRQEIKCDLETALKIHPELVNGSNYSKWIKRWRFTKPIMIDLDVWSQRQGFPSSNVNQKSNMTVKEQSMIIEALKNV